MIPAGLQLIGGNIPHTAHGTHVHGVTIQNSSGGTHRVGATWGFYDPQQGQIVDKSPIIPQTNPNGYQWIRASIGFPQCFASNPDGSFVLSSANHLSHQKMLEDGMGWDRDDLICPNTHPKRIAKVEILIDFRWPANNDVSGWRLASDLGADSDAQVPNPGGSLHGDILFAWNEKVNQAWKDECHDSNDPRNCSIGQTGTQWILDRIENTPTISNMTYTGPTTIADPYDLCVTTCPTAGTTCNDNNSNTTNDIEDGNCNCVGTPISTQTSCDEFKTNGSKTVSYTHLTLPTICSV